MNALDVFTLCSSGEGFPNSLGEAMSCGIPCVTTSVGDVPEILNGTGILVPAREPAALAAGWEKMCNMSRAERNALGSNARARIVQLYSLQIIVARYEKLYEQIGGSDRSASEARLN
jgi:glycosyltransferase involved in cell wall biosynthesis